ncbi:MAG TPA: hypothetical protein VFM75_06935, partial [Modicisalibacter sp.]|nr:hypothetical protein [Modicisalibacter sp.]
MSRIKRSVITLSHWTLPRWSQLRIPTVMMLGIVLLLCWPHEALGQSIPGVISRPLEGGGQQWSLSLQTLLL